jgi:hypothetical protein
MWWSWLDLISGTTFRRKINQKKISTDFSQESSRIKGCERAGTPRFCGVVSGGFFVFSKKERSFFFFLKKFFFLKEREATQAGIEDGWEWRKAFSKGYD